MRILTLAAGAALILLAASPALAGGPRGGGGHGGGGHQPPRPGPCCGHPGGGNTNVNVNVNASARAGAFADARSYLNARAYDVGSAGRGYGGGGGVVYVGGGYGGDGGGYIGGPVYYNEAPYEGASCPSAPFGYIVGGFGRDERRTPRCVGGGRDRCDERDRCGDRGGRYGYSERRDSYVESRYEAYESYEESGAYEYGYVDDRERGGAPYGVSAYDRGYIDGQRDCECRRDRDPAPYPPRYEPEPPRYEAPRYEPAPRPYEPSHDSAPRQYYSQEPGERG